MKTILLATDFSESSKDAARYGFDLACRIGARVVLVNAMIIAAEVPQTGMVSWPEEEFDALLQGYETEIQKFKSELAARIAPDAYRPEVLCINEAGRLTEVVKKADETYQTDIAVIGTHRGGLLSRLLIGNHAEQLIDSTDSPLLIIKPGTIFKPIKKIAFATEFKNPEQDLKIIYRLISLAKLLNAEILLAHVSDQHENSAVLQQKIADYLLDLSNKADYPHIYYRLISNAKTEAGLTWLCEHGMVDMLAMVHHSRNIFAEYFGSSYTKKMNKLLDMPLLVFPLNDK